jgi:3-deoxy-D-manno-octulosonic-acid transferase
VLAPRYLERVSRVAALARAQGLAVGRRSEGAHGEPLVLLDSLGELRLAYRLATVVFVGGSFVRRGGQNILEPAACGKPVLFGPHMENFKDSVRVLLGRGGIQVPDAERLRITILELLSRPEEARVLGQTGRAAVAAVQGASARNATVIVGLIGPGAGGPAA